jgi:hypothetical protein
MMPRYSDLVSYLDTGGKPIFFVHCVKTAGTSLNGYLTRLDGRSRISTYYIDRQYTDILLAEAQQPGFYENHHATHLPFSVLAPVLDRLDASRFHWLVCVRDPVARQVSHYRFLKKMRDLPLIQNNCIDFSSLEAFTDSMPRNSQCRFYHPSGRADDAIAFLDGLGVQVVPVEFMRAVIDGIYTQRGLPPLREIRANRTDQEPPARDLSPAAAALITERFAEDDRLYRTYHGRVAPLMAGLASPTPVETLGTESDLAALRPAAAGGNLHIFGSSGVAEKLLARLRAAGVEPAGFFDSQRSGTLAGLPVRQTNQLNSAQWQAATLLVAAEAFGPVHRIASAHGCGQIVDAFDFALQAEIWRV